MNRLLFFDTKGREVWRELEPLIRELLELGPKTKSDMGYDMGRPSNDIGSEMGSDVKPQLVEPVDPVLDAIFCALGVDERFLENESPNAAPLPVSPASDVGSESSRAIRATAANSANTGSPCEAAATKPWILHVDDDTDLSNVLKLRLEAYGVTVVQAFQGIDGVRHAFNHPADAIILDYQMPMGTASMS